MMIANIMVGICESLMFAHKSGLDASQLIPLLSQGGAKSWWLENCGMPMMRKDYEPGFQVDLFVKDLGLALDECRRMKLSVAGTAQAYQLYTILMAQGKGKKGIHCLIQALEDLNRCEIPKYQ